MSKLINLPLTDVEIGFIYAVLSMNAKNIEKTNKPNINDRLIERIKQITEDELWAKNSNNTPTLLKMHWKKYKRKESKKVNNQTVNFVDKYSYSGSSLVWLTYNYHLDFYNSKIRLTLVQNGQTLIEVFKR